MIGDILTRHGSDKDTYHSYGEVYDRFFPPEFRARATAVLEVGISWGNSLRAWKEVFPNAEVVGLDNASVLVTEPRIESHRCDSTQPDQLAAALGDRTFDAIVDDGSHNLPDQERTWELLFPRLRPGGVYVIEDLQGWDAISRFTVLGFDVHDRRAVKNQFDDSLAVMCKPYSED